MLGRKKKKAPLESQMTLMITPMADIFTLLLVFLLKSFSTGVSSVTPSGSITLPDGFQVSPTVEATKMEIASNSILLEDRKVLDFDHFAFPQNDPVGSLALSKLSTHLQRIRSKNTLNNSTVILILADKKTPLGLMRRILNTTAQTGFLDYKLLVVEDS